MSNSLLGHSGYIVDFRSHFIVDRQNNVLIAVFSHNTTNVPRNITAGLLRILEDRE